MKEASLWAKVGLLSVICAGASLHANDATIGALIRDLDSDSFAIRSKATQDLLKHGSEAISPLKDVVRTGNLEVVSRSLHVLTQLAVEESPLEKGPATIALETLVGSIPRREAQINSAYDRLLNARELQALEVLTKNGAVVLDVYIPERNDFALELRIAESWDGAISRLAYVKHLRQFVRLKVEWIKNLDDKNLDLLFDLPAEVRTVILTGTGITVKGLERLKARHPKVTFEFRRGGSLGLIKGNSAHGVWVYGVMNAATGDPGGIRSGDLLLRSGETVFSDYEAYDKWEATLSEGERVPIRFVRDGVEKEVIVTMGRWLEQDCPED